jgi:hypothetical protein
MQSVIMMHWAIEIVADKPVLVTNAKYTAGVSRCQAAL